MEVRIPGAEDKYCEVRTMGSSLTLALKSPKMRELRDGELDAEPGAQVFDEHRRQKSRLVDGKDERGRH